MARVGVTRVTGLFGNASAMQGATVWIEREGLFSRLCIRPYKRRRVYSMPLNTAADLIVRQIILGELRLQRELKAKKKRLMPKRKP